MASAGDAPPGTSRTPPPLNANTSPPLHLAQRRIIEEFYNFEGWRVRVTKSPILPSSCYCARGVATVGKHNSATEAMRTASTAAPRVSQSPPGTLCQVCRFANELQLTHLPEMVFPDNMLELVYEPTGFTLSFTALNAMKLINTTVSPIHVAYADEWKALKAESGLPVQEALQAFDWTYSTDYKGDMKIDSPTATVEDRVPIRVDSSSRLNLEKLRQREPILFSDEITFYEDELHDNGVSILTAKLRVMNSGFFILLRFFLRVDQVMVRICDTRIHFETGNNHFIRQFQRREQTYNHLCHLQPSVLTNPNLLYEHLPVCLEINETVCLGSSAS